MRITPVPVSFLLLVGALAWGCAGPGDEGGATGTGGTTVTGGTTTARGGTTGTGGTTSNGSSSASCAGTPLSGGQQYCTTYSAGNISGGYHYEIWSDTSGGCMTVYGKNAAFKASWSNVGDFLARIGLKYNETQTHDQIGTFASDFAFTKTGTTLAYFGIYGWSNNPLIEYYIIEDWNGSWRPSFTKKGTITVDGGSYDVYTNVRTNAPSIHGTQTFTQYYSVRQTGRQCGHISISEHFKQWAGLGLPLGKMYEVKLLAEGMNGSGSADFTTATVTVTR